MRYGSETFNRAYDVYAEGLREQEARQCERLRRNRATFRVPLIAAVLLLNALYFGGLVGIVALASRQGILQPGDGTPSNWNGEGFDTGGYPCHPPTGANPGDDIP